MDFEKFWINWPKKVAKKKAEIAWKRLTDLEQALDLVLVVHHEDVLHGAGGFAERLEVPAGAAVECPVLVDLDPGDLFVL